ncbi:MAG: rRNA ((1915)-N(3))-methyltransferase RlmH [Clostridiales bacterium]|jgi:23S rRNA (pseudouridine1915-N3)-methyltransferase|nr:rRNA ((1915)-N(3))-methyltransferase RlmH [Clostridiales bacterium]
MQIQIIAVGKIKERYLRQGISEFSKRICKYAKIEIIEVPDEKAPAGASEKEEEIIKETEGEKILAKIKKDSFVIVLDLHGKQLTSEEMAARMEKLALEGKSSVSFVIGGSLGLSKEVLKEADLRLSFGKMTFPHQLMRLILLEQIFRWFKIMRGETYHK